MKASTVVHDFALDETVPADHRGRSYCKECGRPGTPGDRNHPAGALPAIPRRRQPRRAAYVAQLAAERDRAILGDRDG